MISQLSDVLLDTRSPPQVSQLSLMLCCNAKAPSSMKVKLYCVSEEVPYLVTLFWSGPRHTCGDRVDSV